jgi:hypothetical protein
MDRRRRPTAAAPACGLPLLCRRPDTSMIWVGRPSPPPFLHGDELEQDGIEVWRWRGDEIVSLPRLASSTRTPWRRAAAAWALTSPWPPTAGAAPSGRGPLHSPVGGIGEWQQRAELLDAGPAAAPLGFCGGAGTGGEGKVLVGAGAARLRADAGGPAARWSRRRGKRGGVAREEKGDCGIGISSPKSHILRRSSRPTSWLATQIFQKSPAHPELFQVSRWIRQSRVQVQPRRSIQTRSTASWDPTFILCPFPKKPYVIFSLQTY